MVYDNTLTMEEKMRVLTVSQRHIDLGLAVSGSRYVAMAALKASPNGSILWLRANGSATLFYTGYAMPSRRVFLRQRTWKQFRIRY